MYVCLYRPSWCGLIPAHRFSTHPLFTLYFFLESPRIAGEGSKKIMEGSGWESWLLLRFSIQFGLLTQVKWWLSCVWFLWLTLNLENDDKTFREIGVFSRFEYLISWMIDVVWFSSSFVHWVFSSFVHMRFLLLVFIRSPSEIAWREIAIVTLRLFGWCLFTGAGPWRFNGARSWIGSVWGFSRLGEIWGYWSECRQGGLQ